MKDFIKRLTSRKFLVAVGGALIALSNGQVDLAVQILIAYIGFEGVADLKARAKAGS